jgi:hypothetical protein
MISSSQVHEPTASILLGVAANDQLLLIHSREHNYIMTCPYCLSSHPHAPPQISSAAPTVAVLADSASVPVLAVGLAHSLLD